MVSWCRNLLFWNEWSFSWKGILPVVNLFLPFSLCPSWLFLQKITCFMSAWTQHLRCRRKISFFFLLQHTKRRHLQKYEKRYVHYSLLIVQLLKLLTIQYLRFLQIRHCILFTTLTLLTYNTYGTYNTILILLKIIPYLYYLQWNIFFNLKYIYNFVVLVQYFLWLTIITEKRTHYIRI